MSEFPAAASAATSAPVIPVSMLNRLARERLESAFPLCWVAGEVSNLSYATSGHVYFSLKDSTAQVRCVMFRSRAQLIGWRLENGQHIEARVLVSLYEARGDFQLNVETARRAGVGNFYEQFLRIKDRLEREGLFASEAKRPLPAFPRRLGIVTSLQAAALRDVLTTLQRRAPQLAIIIYPTPVQGEGAAAQISATIRTASQRAECDVLIVCRGGGSIEDLWAFNDEDLARAIRACSIPILTGIGHETDFTIADFAADQRAATPTAAAELAAPAYAALQERLVQHRATLRRQIDGKINRIGQQLDWLARRLQHPAQSLARQREALLNLQRRLDNSLAQAAQYGRRTLADLTRRLLLARPDTTCHGRRLDALAAQLRGTWHRTAHENSAALERIESSLTHLNPSAVLARGYGIVTDSKGHILRDSRTLEPSDGIVVHLHRGRANATVTLVNQDTDISSIASGTAAE